MIKEAESSILELFLLAFITHAQGSAQLKEKKLGKLLGIKSFDKSENFL